MKIQIVTPAPPGSRKGNRVTAERYQALLRELGHTTRVTSTYQAGDWNLLIALHAYKSAAAVQAYRRNYPRRPVVLVLTGTDLYHDLPRQRSARWAVQAATRLVVLQGEAVDALPPRDRDRTTVIIQSASPCQQTVASLKSCFEVCVVGHLRTVKDPLRAAMAVRRLPSSSRLRVTHLGEALTDGWARRAQAEAGRNPRYRWLGNVRRGRTQQIIARSHALIVTSRAEGGPSAIAEAIVNDVPVIGTDIPGVRGLVGPNYPALFPVGDTAALRDLLLRLESDRQFRRRLQTNCRRRAGLFHPSKERQAWRRLIGQL